MDDIVIVAALRSAVGKFGALAREGRSGCLGRTCRFGTAHMRSWLAMRWGCRKGLFTKSGVGSVSRPKTSVDTDAQRRQRLRLALAVTLAVKFLALAMIWSTWFSHPQGKRIDGNEVGSAIYASPPALHEQGGAHARP
jgi:hypothetical protein